MSTPALTYYTTTLQTLNCYKCGVPFGMSQSVYNERRNDGLSFWCPNGHSQIFAKTEVTRLRERLAYEERRRANVEEDLRAAKADHAVTKGKLTKTRNRIAAGVCPHCNRTFQNVARHMTSQHPAT